MDPRRRRWPLLRDAVEQQGLPRRERAHGQRGRGSTVALDRRGIAPRRGRRQLVHARPAGGRSAAVR